MTDFEKTINSVMAFAYAPGTDPALIREDRFDSLYGPLPQEEKRNLSKPEHSTG